MPSSRWIQWCSGLLGQWRTEPLPCQYWEAGDTPLILYRGPLQLSPKLSWCNGTGTLLWQSWSIHHYHHQSCIWCARSHRMHLPTEERSYHQRYCQEEDFWQCCKLCLCHQISKAPNPPHPCTHHPHVPLQTFECACYIQAQWPDPDRKPLLFETMKTCMVHGPCGNLNPHAPCMKDGKCTKHYPWAFQEHTMMDKDGYPLYAPPNNGQSYKVRGVMVDNRWIVPYNPFLSAKYNCHINVECAANVHSIKYIFKYIHKGGDHATMEVELNEIKAFLNGWWPGAPEALWQIFHYPMHQQSPPVVWLQVHLEDHQMVLFDKNNAFFPEQPPATTLTAFFDANQDPGLLGEQAQQLLYQEFPQEFWWMDGECQRQVWRKGFSIGRMYFVPPSTGKRFYLHLLLTVVRGPISFKDLKTYNSGSPSQTNSPLLNLL